jgi:histidinol-phosphatase (PHP family)
MRLDRLDEYIAALQTMKKELDDDSFTLRIGLEVDFFFENADSVLKNLMQYPLDYLIGSVHYSDIFPVDHSIGPWLPLTEEQKAEICEEYWRKLEGAAQRKEFTFIGHLDLPKKFGLINNEDYFSHAIRILDLVEKSGIGIELNTAGWFKECQEQYPSLAILKEANRRKIPVVVNADAHDPAHLMRNFEMAAEVLRKAGYPDR